MKKSVWDQGHSHEIHLENFVKLKIPDNNLKCLHTIEMKLLDVVSYGISVGTL